MRRLIVVPILALVLVLSSCTGGEFAFTGTVNETPVSGVLIINTPEPEAASTVSPTVAPSPTMEPTAPPTAEPTAATEPTAVPPTPTAIPPTPTETPVALGNWWVATTGSDTAAGSQAAPFKTINKALSLAQPGDTIVVRPGTYGAVKTVRSGLANAPIVLRAENPAATSQGARSIVSGSSSYGIEIAGHNYIVIDGFEVRGWEVGIASTPWLSTTQGVGLRITNNYFTANDAVAVECSSCNASRIEGNLFYDPGLAYPQQTEADQDYGVALYGGGDNIISTNVFTGKFHQVVSVKFKSHRNVIADNYFNGCMYTCIYVGQNDDGFGEPGDLTGLGATVERNTITDARDPNTNAYYRVSNGITIRNIQDAVVRDNVISGAFNQAIIILKFQESSQKTGQAPIRATITGNQLSRCIVTDPHSGASDGARVLLQIQNRGYTSDVITVQGNAFATCPRGVTVASGISPAPTITGNTYTAVPVPGAA